MQFGAVTDIGMHRKINEDNYYVNESDTLRTEWAVIKPVKSQV